MQGAAQVPGLAGLELALAHALDGVDQFLPGLVGLEQELHLDVLAILGQTQAIGGGAEVELVDQPSDQGPDLLELCRGHAAVHQDEHVCKLLLQG